MATGLDQEALDALRPAERMVAEYLLEAGPEALVMSAAALAERLGTSDATVVRTAR
ncbi:MAG: Helix-turn-helix domain, rpiR family, partial [Ilumatobacteraceae bacterium]|nr:Helix-turn-helix domain, rpiR family [Ilumatobacteraceae bacterium]